MTTAEALAVVREALEGEWFSEEVDAALALIGGRLEELEAFRLRGNARRLAEAEAERDELRSRHAQLIEEANTESLNAAGYRTEVARLLERCAELEAALRAYEDDSLTEDEFRAIARRALGGGE